MLQELERHAKEVSQLNQTLTVQVQTLSAQIQILYGQLEAYRDCSCGAAEKAKTAMREAGTHPHPMDPNIKIESVADHASSSSVHF